MKKVLILLISVFILTGCNIEKLNMNNIDKTIDLVINNDSYLVNTVSRGYKYYLPSGVSIINVNSYNEKLLYNNEHYYLYIDIVSYYHKTKYNYVVNNNVYFSKKIENGNIDGYIEINKVKDKYFIEAVYNYAKIEAYVSEINLNNSIINISYIISSIKFNDSLANLLLAQGSMNLTEEKFNIFQSKRDEGTFLQYIEEYDKYNKEVLIDENTGELGNED